MKKFSTVLLTSLFILGSFTACRTRTTSSRGNEVKATYAQPMSVSPAERTEAERWLAAKFLGKQDEGTETGALFVSIKSGVIGRNAISGRPLRIVHQEYSRGLSHPVDRQGDCPPAGSGQNL